MDANISKNVIGVWSVGGKLNIDGNVIVYGSDPEDLQYVELDVPPLCKTFQGREEDMQNMDNLLFLKNKRKIAISGLPGYGKSELAKQYANICLTNKKVDKIFWINAENPGNLQSVTLKKAYKHFHDKRCMFIFDNGIKLQDIHEYGPPDKENFYLLITSQELDWGDDIESIKLDALSSDAAIEIYKNILCEKFNEENLDLYKTIACLIGCVPLGLQITGNYIRQEMKKLGKDFQLKEYVKNLEDSQEKLVTTKIPSNVPNSYTKSIYSAIMVSLEKIDNEDAELRDLALNTLYVCSYFNPEKINVDELLQVPNIKEILDRNKSDKKQYKRALYILGNFSFINYHPNETLISMHRLTQDILRFHINLEPKYYLACLRYVFSKEITDKNYFDFWITLGHGERNVSKVYMFHNELLPKTGNMKQLINSVVEMFKTEECNYEYELHRKFLQGLVLYGNMECIKKIFSEKSNYKYINTCKMLHVAAKRNMTVILQYLLPVADINAIDVNKETALHAAARKWYFNAIHFLIEHKANNNIKNNLGNTPLFTLTENETFFHKPVNWAETLKLFKYEKNTINNNKESIIHLAALYYRVELLEVLLTEYEEDPNQQDVKGRTPLHFITTAEYFNLFTDDKLVCAKLLILHGGLFNIEDENGETTETFLLHAAIKYNHLELLELMLRKGADVNSKDVKYEDTPFHIAMESWNYEAMKILIPYDPDIEAFNKFKFRAINKFFLSAPIENAIDIFNTFMKMEQNFNKNNERFLRLAVTTCREDILRFLISTYKFNPNTQNAYKNTPLHCLVYIAICYPGRYSENSLKSIADYLIEQGASIDIKNIDGKRPEDLVLENNLEFLKSCFHSNT